MVILNGLFLCSSGREMCCNIHHSSHRPNLPPSFSYLFFFFFLFIGVQNRMDLNERIAEAEAREEEEGREEVGDGQVFVVTEPVKTKEMADVVVGKAEEEEGEEVHSHHLRGGPAAY